MTFQNVGSKGHGGMAIIPVTADSSHAGQDQP